MVQFFAINGLINALAALALVLYLIAKRNDHRMSFFTILVSIAMCIWSTGYWLWLSSDTASSTLFFSRMLSIGSTLIPIFIVHWIIVFLKDNNHKIFLQIGYFITFIFLIFGFSKFFVSGVTQVGYFQFWPQAGLLYTFYILISYIGFLGYGLFLLGKYYLKERGLIRPKYRIIFLGMIMCAIGGFTNFPAWYGIPIFPFGNVLTTFLFFILGYAILHYRIHSSYMRLFGRI